jgi:hypothetical protein
MGIMLERGLADANRVIWPVAALAVLFLGFVVVYGSVLQSRLEAGVTDGAPDDSATEA